jgi:hypothetical protein
MDGIILCNLLAEKIPAEQFQLWGTDVHWTDKAFDTPENNAIVADVIENYETLAVVAEKAIADEATQQQREARYRAESDPLFFREQRGEVKTGTWQAKVKEIRADLPYTE